MVNKPLVIRPGISGGGGGTLGAGGRLTTVMISGSWYGKMEAFSGAMREILGSLGLYNPVI